MTHTELDRKVASLRAIGPIYEPVAYYVERMNRPHCIDERTTDHE